VLALITASHHIDHVMAAHGCGVEAAVKIGQIRRDQHARAGDGAAASRRVTALGGEQMTGGPSQLSGTRPRGVRLSPSERPGGRG